MRFSFARAEKIFGTRNSGYLGPLDEADWKDSFSDDDDDFIEESFTDDGDWANTSKMPPYSQVYF